MLGSLVQSHEIAFVEDSEQRIRQSINSNSLDLLKKISLK